MQVAQRHRPHPGREVGWRGAAATWLITLAAVGVGIAIWGGPNDGTHHDYCGHDTSVPPVTTQVLLTAQEPEPVIHVHVGDSFIAKIDGGASSVVEPSVARRGVVCLVTRSAPSVHVAVTFVATSMGTTRLLSTFNHIAGGLAAGAFTATVVVAPRS